METEDVKVQVSAAEVGRAVGILLDALVAGKVSPVHGTPALLEVFTRSAINLVKVASTEEARESNRRSLLGLLEDARKELAELVVTPEAREELLGAVAALREQSVREQALQVEGKLLPFAMRKAKEVMH